jgi:hypothetical protein
MITVQNIEARRARRDELGRGLAKELVIIREGNDPLLYLERKAYLNALADAIAGVECARIALATALVRMGEAARALPPSQPEA